MNKLTQILIFLLLVTNSIKTNCYARDIAKELKIISQLEAIDPPDVENFKAGTKAMDENNYVLADSLYSIVYKNAPSFDPLIRRLGTINVALGKAEVGIALCEKALSINRSAYNIISLATCYYYAGDKSKNYEDDLGKALILMKEAEKLPNGDEVDFPTLICQIALELNDITELRISTNKLLKKYPEEVSSHYFAAILSSIDEDWYKAKDEILIAKKLGLQDERVQKFLDSGVQSKVTTRQSAKIFAWIIGIWIIGIALLFLIGKILSNITIKSLEKQSSTTEISGFEKSIRSIYGWIMNFGGVYYYISLPIILILVITLVVGLFYLFLFIGRIPIQLMFVLTIGSAVTIYGMIRSLLLKVNYSDPGRELKREEAPDLFKLAEEVAKTIGTRPIDEIRITHFTDLAVYERGSWREKLQDKAKRILILGTAVLKDFKKDEFCAVLAHEYGHFSHRDTAGGEVAMRVRNDMNKYFYALYTAGQNVWWNIAFQFLRLYNLIFLRISHGSTRLQEVLADRVAAQQYGKAAFQNGLIYVIKSDIEFTKYANSEIEDAKRYQRPFKNLYELTGTHDKEVEDELNKELNRKTSEFDTHPSPVDRFKYISSIKDAVRPISNVFYIKDLFLNWEALTIEMTSLIEKDSKK